MIGRAATARAAACLAVLVAVSACGGSTPQTVLPAGSPIDDDTTLHEGDSFDVTVYGESDLSGKHRVAEDGSITFPLIGKLDVEGKSATAIADLIREALIAQGILKKPTVSVFVTDRRSKQISIMGAIAKPGSYPMTSGLTLIQAIGAAGGLTPLSRGSEGVLTRQVDGARKRFRVDIEGITEGRAPDFALQAGDILYVPERIF